MGSPSPQSSPIEREDSVLLPLVGGGARARQAVPLRWHWQRVSSASGGLYPPYNGFQAGSKAASTHSTLGRHLSGEHKVRPYDGALHAWGVQRGEAPLRFSSSPFARGGPRGIGLGEGVAVRVGAARRTAAGVQYCPDCQQSRRAHGSRRTSESRSNVR
jgi:hypothetical protein